MDQTLTSTTGLSLPSRITLLSSDFNEWFASVVKDTGPVTIVGIARAAIRLLQLHQPSIGPLPVVSQYALPFLSENDIRRKNVLLFDDSVIFGSTMKNVRDYLLSMDAVVSCASYVVDRTAFYGHVRWGSSAAPTKSPHSLIPLQYKHLLWPSQIRQHHDRLVGAIQGSTNHYNFDFPTFRLTLPPGFAEDIPFYVLGLRNLPGVLGVFETSSTASTQNGIYRYSVLLNPRAQDVFGTDLVQYRSHLKLRVLFAPDFGDIRLIAIPQLTISNRAQFSDVVFNDPRLTAVWQTLHPPRDGDPWYSQALLRLLGIFVGTCLGASLARLFAASILRREPGDQLTLVEDDLNFVTGHANSGVLTGALQLLCSVGIGQLSDDGQTLGCLAVLDSEDESLVNMILQAWRTKAFLKPEASESLYSAVSRILLSLREVTDTPELRCQSPEMSRLELGLTFRDLQKLLDVAGVSALPEDLTLAVDLCVDNGQAVPKVVNRGTTWLRVFCSGESYNSNDLQQLECAISDGYTSVTTSQSRKKSLHLSPFDIHKLCVFLKDVLPWLPISSRFYTFGRQALVGQHQDEIVPWLTGSRAPFCRISEGQADVIIPNPQFKRYVKPSWDPNRSRDFYDAFQYTAIAFGNRGCSSEAKLLISTCRTHRHTYNAVAVEAHSWVSHSKGDFPHFVAAIADGVGSQISHDVLFELYWCIQYLTEAIKKWKVFHHKFSDLEKRLSKAFSRQGPAAERFWEFKVREPGLLDPTIDKEIVHRFQCLIPIVTLMRYLTVYTVRALEKGGSLALSGLKSIFAEHGIDLNRGEYSWLTGCDLAKAANSYNDASANCTHGKTILKTRMEYAPPSGDATAWLRSVIGIIQSAVSEIGTVLNCYCPRYDLGEGDFPYSPDRTKRLRADGSTESLHRNVWVLTMDIIGSTDDSNTNDLKTRILHLLEKFLRDRGQFEPTGNDQFVAFCADSQVLLDLSQAITLEGEAAARSATSLQGTRKALSFGTVSTVEDAQGGVIIRDAEIPHLLPTAFGILKAVDKCGLNESMAMNKLIAIEESTFRRFSRELNFDVSNGIPVRVEAKHFNGECLLFHVPGRR